MWKKTTKRVYRKVKEVERLRWNWKKKADSNVANQLEPAFWFISRLGELPRDFANTYIQRDRACLLITRLFGQRRHTPYCHQARSDGHETNKVATDLLGAFASLKRGHISVSHKARREKRRGGSKLQPERNERSY